MVRKADVKVIRTQQVNYNGKKTVVTDRIPLETNATKRDKGRHVAIKGSSLQGLWASLILSRISCQSINKKNCKTTSKNYNPKKKVNNRVLFSKVSKDEVYLTDEVSAIDTPLLWKRNPVEVLH